VFVVISCDEHLDEFGFDFQGRGRGGGDVAQRSVSLLGILRSAADRDDGHVSAS
jgi:hypothetical protein